MRQRFFLLGIALAAVSAVLIWSSVSDGRFHECESCHDTHGGGPSVFLLWASYPTVEALCLSCHGPGGISTLKAEVHQNDPDDSSPDYGVWQITCRECHNPHEGESFTNWCPGNCNGEGTGTNIKMVGDSNLDASGYTKIDTPNSGLRHVVFESRGTTVGDPSLHSFCDRDQDGNGYYDGVCDTCHTKTFRHRHTSSSGMAHSHQRGKTCTTSNCHSHIKTFNP